VSGSACGADSLTLAGSDNAEKVFNFFTSKELTPIQAVGIMGNLQAESGFDPAAQEKNPKSGRGGFGIAQWTGGRREALEQAARDQGVDVADLSFQLNYLYNESVNRKSLDYPSMSEWDGLKQQTTVALAVTYWERNYERAGVPRVQQRIQFANDLLTKFGSGTVGSSGTTVSACGADGSGQVVGSYSLPVDRHWYDEHPDWFTKPHHEYPAADIPVPSNTTVYAMTDGKIIKAPVGGDCGTGVLIDAGNGIQIVYCHGSDGGSVALAKVGDQVKAGQPIMHSDNTGHSTGPHLHVQIKVDGQNRCPQNLFVGIANGAPPDITALPASGCTYGSNGSTR